MAYNKINKLKKVIKIQKIVLEHKSDSVSYKEIYWTYIHQQFNISMRTFTTYLGVPAKRDLKNELELEAQREQAKKDQLKLF